MTDKKDEALKLALEAAEVLETLFKQAEAMHEEVTAGVNVHCQITVADLSKGLYAASAIREALAEQPAQQQQEPEYKGWYCAHCQRGVDGSEVTYHEQHTVCGRVITDDLPPAAQQQEPVARLRVLTDSVDMGQSLAPSRRYKTATATTYAAAMELPLGYYDLYTSQQPSKPWVGLTDGDIQEVRENCGITHHSIKTIEAKLREKNA